MESCLMPLFGALAVSTNLATTAFTTVFVVALTHELTLIYPLAVTATVFDSAASSLLAALFLATAMCHDARLNQSRHIVHMAVGTAGLLIVAAGLTLALLVLMQISNAVSIKTSLGGHASSLLAAVFVLWGVSVLSQAAFILTALGYYQSSANKQSSTPPETQSIHCETEERKQPLILHLLPDDDAQKMSKSSLVNSASSDEVAPTHPSVQYEPQLTSARPNMRRHCSAPHEIQSSDRDRHAVTPSTLESAAREYCAPRTPLEPIPGSRPDSPARALELANPFPEAPQELQSPQSSTPTTGSSPTSPPFSEDEIRLARRFKTRKPRSLPSIHAIDESHIHPLFRTDCPLPPPTPTLGTVVTASAFGGQFMSQRSLSRERSRSRPNSPARNASTRARSRSRSCASSVNNSSSLLLGTASCHGLEEKVPPLPDRTLTAYSIVANT